MKTIKMKAMVALAALAMGVAANGCATDTSDPQSDCEDFEHGSTSCNPNSGGNAGNSGQGGSSGNAGSGGQGGNSGSAGNGGTSGSGGTGGITPDSGTSDASDASPDTNTADVTTDSQDDGSNVDSGLTDALDAPADITTDMSDGSVPDTNQGDGPTADTSDDSADSGITDAASEPEAAAPNCGSGTKACPDNPTQCTDILSDSKHCGSTCSVCGTGTVCSMGQCVLNCSGGTPDSCGTSCVNFMHDPGNCGACGNTCDSSLKQACLGGLCLIGPPKAPCVVQDPTVFGLCKIGVVSDNGSTCLQTIKKGDLAEVCDGKDNNCDGNIDEGLNGSYCDTPWPGACKAGTLSCVAGVASCKQNNLPSDEICDNVDNDCNGVVDDNPTDLGPCHTGNFGLCDPGSFICEPGGIKKCIGLQPGTLPEICDGQDNNCDGHTDEPTVKDNKGNPIVYGTGGTCADHLPGLCSNASFECQNGGLVCVPGKTPTAEVCNGFDDDCNGLVDDGDPGGGGKCTVSGERGACADGIWHCQNGGLTCVPNQPNPQPEICDGIDNDCSGYIDDNLADPNVGKACTVPNLPASIAAGSACTKSTTTCSAGKVTCAPSVTPQLEACNGKDDDCDGTVDNNLPFPFGQTCVIQGQSGPCQFSKWECDNGAQACPVTFIKGVEICDNIDNDCSGRIDDNLNDPRLNQSCPVTNPLPGIKGGPCMTSTTTCGPGGTIACNQSVSPTTETCNGKDDDCDGTIDDNLADPNVGKACTVPNLPASIAAGSPCTKSISTCSGGVVACPVSVTVKTETCNNVDDDCDGLIDDNTVEVIQRASCVYKVNGSSSFPTKPLCSAGVVTACSAGVESCDPLNVVGETCNGIDDDCDGVVDDAPSGSSLCVAPKVCKGAAGCQ